MTTEDSSPSTAPTGAAIKPAHCRLSVAFTSFVIVFGLSYFSILITRGGHGLATIWPANAIVLVLLLRSPHVDNLREDLVVSAIAGSILANWLGGHTLPLSLWFTLANSVEIFIAFALVRRGSYRTPSPDSGNVILQQFLNVLRAALVGPAAAATLAAGGLAVLAGADYRDSWLEWFFTSALGLLIISPLGIRLHKEDLRELRTKGGLRRAVLCIILCAGVAAFVFTQKVWPLLFLITPAALISAYWHRALGATAAIVVVALISVPLTANGYGPLSLFQIDSPKDQQFLLQFFLLTQSLIALTLAAILDDRDGLRRALEYKEKATRDKAAGQALLLTNVAHEMRTPLNAILGLSEMLQTKEQLSEQGQRLVETIVGASSELQALANDLLDRSRIESGALRIQPQTIAIAPLLAEIENELQASEDQTLGRLQIHAGDDLTLWADPLRTKQIMRNLIVNSLKYAGDYGPVIVRATRNGTWVRIEVLDRGPGIPRIRHHEVFEPFGRLGPNSTTSLSAGFGLSMVKLLAEAQGGLAGFSSTPHIETLFWVDLPGSAAASTLTHASDEEVSDTVIDEIFGR